MEEKKKRTGNGRSPAEVELKDLKTRERKASRNSWTDIYNENTTLHKHKRLLGQEVETDDGLWWRVKWGQRGAGVCGLLILICYVARQWVATTVFAKGTSMQHVACCPTSPQAYAIYFEEHSLDRVSVSLNIPDSEQCSSI